MEVWWRAQAVQRASSCRAGRASGRLDGKLHELLLRRRRRPGGGGGGGDHGGDGDDGDDGRSGEFALVAASQRSTAAACASWVGEGQAHRAAVALFPFRT